MNITLSWANLPEGYCWRGPQQYMDDIFSLLIGAMPGNFTGIIIGNTIPQAVDQDKLWARIDNAGYLEGIYKFQGVWHRPHPVPPSSSELRIWKGLLTDLDTYDGGSVGAVTDTTGPFWEVETVVEGRFLIAAGDTPGGTTLDVGDTGGIEEITLGITNIPSHTHELYVSASDGIETEIRAAVQTTDASVGGGITPVYLEKDAGSSNTYIKAAGGDPGDSYAAAPITGLMPPYYCVAYIRRTARKHYTVT